MNLENSPEIIQLLRNISESLTGIGSKLDKLILAQKVTVYTDRELFELKDNDGLSWSQLSKRTGISVSTLQSRVRRYKNEKLADWSE